MLCESEVFECVHAILCFFWALYESVVVNVLEKETLDECAVDVDGKLDLVCGPAVLEVMIQVQSDVEFGASDRFHECRCAHVTVLRSVFDEWHAIDADGDRSTGETIGVHGGSGAMWVYVVSDGVVARGVLVGEVEVESKAERPSGSL